MTKRGERFLGILFLAGLLAMMGIAGAIETQSDPITVDCDALHAQHIANPNDLDTVSRAWDNGCPFTDENGQYLYEWIPVSNQ